VRGERVSEPDGEKTVGYRLSFGLSNDSTVGEHSKTRRIGLEMGDYVGCGINRDVGGFQVADFPDHNQVGALVAESTSERRQPHHLDRD
jgi:hypothetical protein